ATVTPARRVAGWRRVPEIARNSLGAATAETGGNNQAAVRMTKATIPLIGNSRRHADRQTIVEGSLTENRSGNQVPNSRCPCRSAFSGGRSPNKLWRGEGSCAGGRDVRPRRPTTPRPPPDPRR